MIPVAVVALMPLVAPVPLTADEKRRSERRQWMLERFASDEYAVRPDPSQRTRPGVDSSQGRFETVVPQPDTLTPAEKRFRELAQQANDHYTAGKLDKALEDLNAAIKMVPECAQLWEFRARIMSDRKEYDKAQSDLDKAHILDPKSASILCSRGLLLYTRGKLDNAEFDLIASLNLAPQYELAWYALGLVRAAQGEHELAIVDFTQAIELNANDPNNYVSRGDMRGRQQDWEKAADDYTKAIELDPKSVLALCRRGYARLEQREYDKAFDDYTRAVDLDPKSATAHTGRGASYGHRKDFKASAAEYEKAVECDPKYTVALYYLTYMYALLSEENLRDPEKAVARGKKLVAAAPAVWWAQQALAVAHAEAGDFDAAVTGMRKVLECEDLSHEDRETAEWYIELFLASKTVSSTREE